MVLLSNLSWRAPLTRGWPCWESSRCTLQLPSLSKPATAMAPAGPPQLAELKASSSCASSCCARSMVLSLLVQLHMLKASTHTLTYVHFTRTGNAVAPGRYAVATVPYTAVAHHWALGIALPRGWMPRHRKPHRHDFSQPQALLQLLLQLSIRYDMISSLLQSIMFDIWCID